MKLYIGSYFSFYTPDRQHWVEQTLTEPTSLAEVLSTLGIPAAEVYLIVVNGQLVDSIDILLSNHDTIRIYPAIGGG
jgi:sulfur carrier protein ThiS